MERQRARRKLDAKGVARKGKDVAHVKALSKGGSNKDGIKLEAPSKNRSFKRDSQGNLVSETSKKERKKK
jgi:YD repeat-containing protein